MQMRLRTGILSLVIAVASVGAARADATLTFSASTMSLAAEGTVEFDGTLTNTGDDLLYLNGDQFNLLYPDLSVDDSPFIFDGPLSLLPGDSWEGAFIDVTAHYCPVKTRTESVGWSELAADLCSPSSEVPVKWVFSRIR